MAVIAFAAGFLEHLGYAPTASIVVMALLQILGGSHWRRNLVISLAAGAVSHFLFVRWLQIPFPQDAGLVRDDFVSPILVRFIRSRCGVLRVRPFARFARLELGLHEVSDQLFVGIME
jgi:hypothetical protein